MDETHKTTIPEWLRWILVLPGSIVGAFLIMFPIHWVVMLIQFAYKEGDTTIVDGPSSLLACIPPEMLEYFGYALFVPMVLIIAGAAIAPKFKFQTGIAMAILFGTLCGFCFGTIFGGKMQVDISWLRLAITIVLWIIGITCGLYFVYKESPQSKLLRVSPIALRWKNDRMSKTDFISTRQAQFNRKVKIKKIILMFLLLQSAVLPVKHQKS